MKFREPRLHWFRYSLRTLFVFVTLFSCFCSWVAYEMNWIRQRHDVLGVWGAGDGLTGLFPIRPDAAAPGMLGLFGEGGYGCLIRGLPKRADRILTAEEEAELSRVKRLFPEANVAWLWE